MFESIEAILVLSIGVICIHLAFAIAARDRVRNLVEALRSAMPIPSCESRVPVIIQDYVRRSTLSKPPAQILRIHQQGEMRLVPDGPWYHFDAEQTVSLVESAFVWWAKVKIAPFIHLTVVDAYVGGQGILEVRLFGSILITRASGLETSRGEAMRYLAELAWTPQAMISNPHLHWRQIDQETVEVSTEVPSEPVAVEFKFSNSNMIGVTAANRPRTQGTHITSQKWLGRFHAFDTMNGFWIPTEADASWVTGDAIFTYWRGKTLSLTALGPSTK